MKKLNKIGLTTKWSFFWIIALSAINASGQFTDKYNPYPNADFLAVTHGNNQFIAVGEGFGTSIQIKRRRLDSGKRTN